MSKAAVLLAILAVPAGPARAADQPVKLPKDLAELISAAQDNLRNNKPRDAISRLAAFSGQDHALRHLLLGHACVQLSDLPEAADAYTRALAMDGEMKQAGIALAQVQARLENWSGAAELLGRFAAVDSCDADLLFLYAQVARQLEDQRLCRLLVDKGAVRFPGDLRFRRLDLALLVDEADYAAAARAAMGLLKESPADALLWRQLAFAHGRTGRDVERLSALEASVLCEPGDLDRRRRFLAAQLAAGDWLTAIKHGRSLLAGPLAEAAGADRNVMELLITAADMGRQDDLLAGWLESIGEDARTRTMHLVAARLALRTGEPKRARRALQRLIRAGETDPAVFLWAGHIAEQTEDRVAAETLYRQAAKLTGRSARLARLYLARLLFRRRRADEAARLLRSYLDTWPEDSAARALLSLIEAADGQR